MIIYLVNILITFKIEDKAIIINVIAGCLADGILAVRMEMKIHWVLLQICYRSHMLPCCVLYWNNMPRT